MSLMIYTVTRSHKLNTRDHTGPSDGSVDFHENLPRYFAKSGPIDADPKKTKKNGGGKGNWGRSGDEMEDCGYSLTNARRHSNSSFHGIADFKTKFESVEPEPVFEEQLHGPMDESSSDGSPVGKVRSVSSSHSGLNV